MSARSFWRGLFWSLLALLLVIHVAGGWYFSSELIEDGFVPGDEAILAPAGDVTVEETSYQSPLGEMDAYFFPGSRSTWVIHVHGKGATPEEAEHLFGPVQDAGYPQLWITYRNDEGQPSDPSGYYQYGATEWEDVAAAVDYAMDNGAESVVLSGLSTGASHVLAFLYRNNLDVVSGLIFDSPNIDFGDTVDHNAAQREMPVVPMNVPSTISGIAKFMTSLRIDVNWKALDYVDDADVNLRVPVLVHHGSDDATVPFSQSSALFSQAPDLVTVIQTEADHMGSYDADPEKYLDAVLSFLQQVD